MAKGVYPYFRAIEGKQGTEVEMGGHHVLMFGSNAYTGLPGDERVIEAGVKALRKYGSGCAGSRFLNGTLDLHLQLEKELAEFVGKDEALCFSTGFTVNSGVIAALTGRDDYIICDDRDHASIVDGRRLSFSTCLKYKHNDMEDLERQLQKCAPEAVKLIVVDGVFSMEGDLANLPEIVRLKHKYNATIMVDEAHGLGVFGKNGRGVCDHFGLTSEVDLIMGTFSKSLASIGGFIAADRSIIKWSEDPAVYIANALSPAKVVSVDVAESEKMSRVVVPDYQLSLAIGKEGQNARLAAKLTGWKIDIKSETQAEEEGEFQPPVADEPLTDAVDDMGGEDFLAEFEKDTFEADEAAEAGEAADSAEEAADAEADGTEIADAADAEAAPQDEDKVEV